MSLKNELKSWAAALDACNDQNYERALDIFGEMDRSATVLTNMGLLNAAMGHHEKALRRFTDATARDPYLTISYFQRGVSHFLLERYRPASRDFKRAWLSLRGNEEINYEQLGLQFRLFASEVLFNLGLSRIRLGRMDKGLEYMEKAKRLTMIEDHEVIDDVIRDKGEGYTVFSIVSFIGQASRNSRVSSASNICRKRYVHTMIPDHGSRLSTVAFNIFPVDNL
ncbi:hypothetical protein DFH09DRAFT_1043882 [Mycena vulgaris]|nr:hypothetical protein DFH09DRAFT_1043882 [Mycena vulgaris]